MYTLQYWNERDAEWRGCGVQSPDRAFVQLRRDGFTEQSGGCVRFRIISRPA